MSTKTSTSTTPSRPRVLLLSLHLESWFDDMYAFHLAKLRAAADVQRAETPNAAIQQLLSSDPPPCAVLVTDAALASPAGDDDVVNPAYAPVHDALLQYVRSRGGTAVFMGHFPSFVAPPDVPGFFARAGLPWDVASYQRENFELNPAAVKGRVGGGGEGVAAKLPAGYSQKALTVKGVKPGEVWYGSRELPREAAVALGKVGSGWIGYMGDVNAEEDSAGVILGLCGLL